MKKIFLCTSLFFSLAVQAQFVQNPAKNQENLISTVQEVKKMKDDTWVVMQGKIEQKTGHEEYLFADNTGAITVEIDHDVWKGTVVTPQDKVEIIGELDKGVFSDEVEVKKIKVIQ